MSTIIAGNSGLSRELSRANDRVSRLDGKLLSGPFATISNLCQAAKLPGPVADVAKEMYKKASDLKLLKGKSQEAIIASCVHAAARQERTSRSFQDMSAISGVEKKVIGQCFKILDKAFGITARGGAPGGIDGTSGASAEQLIPRFCSALGLNPRQQTWAKSVCTAVRENSLLTGKSPLTVAAGSIFFATHLSGAVISAKDIQDVVRVSHTTILQAYRYVFQSHCQRAL